MKNRIVQTEKAPAAIGPYSQAVESGRWLFVSGQLGLDPESGAFAGESFDSQARQALENMKQIIMAAGFDLTDVVSVDVYLTDMERFADFNEIYAGYFSEHHPARAAVGVAALPRGGLVEVRCTARKSG